jgi:hypothetical protein
VKYLRDYRPVTGIGPGKVITSIDDMAELAKELFDAHGFKYGCDSAPPSVEELANTIRHLVKSVHDDREVQCATSGRFCVIRNGLGGVSIMFDLGWIDKDAIEAALTAGKDAS